MKTRTSLALLLVGVLALFGSVQIEGHYRDKVKETRAERYSSRYTNLDREIRFEQIERKYGQVADIIGAGSILIYTPPMTLGCLGLMENYKKRKMKASGGN